MNTGIGFPREIAWQLQERLWMFFDPQNTAEARGVSLGNRRDHSSGV